jgi:hypothetical protein
MVTIVRRVSFSAQPRHQVQLLLPSGDQLVVPEWMLDEEHCRGMSVVERPLIALCALLTLRSLIDARPGDIDPHGSLTSEASSPGGACFAKDSAEPIPAQEASHEKATLKHVVQLLKRWRDIYYQDRCDEAPISMVLTTLAARFYRGHSSVSEAMSSILDGIEGAVNAAMPDRIYVLNPAN